jgi:hypothetical protein
MKKRKNLIKVLSIITFTLATVTVASIFYEGLILKWLDYVGVFILMTDIAFVLTTIAGLFYYKKHNLLFFCHLFSTIIIAVAIVIAIFQIEFSKYLFLLWEFYILYFYGIIIAKKLWNYKKSDSASSLLVKLHTIPENSAITKGFGEVHYVDSFCVKKATDDSLQKVTADIFALPAWVQGLLRMRDLIVKPFGLKTGKEVNNDKEKSVEGYFFPVLELLDNEVVMGENDAHLNFRASVLINRSAALIFITTVVHYNNFWGRLYFFPVRPFHGIIVKACMKRLIKNDSSKS